MSCDRTRVARRLRQGDPCSDVRLGAGGPQRAHRLDAGLERVEPLGGRRERQPEAEVLALPPAGADPDERPASRDHVEGGRRLGGDPRRPERHRGDQRAEPQAGVEPGEQAERHPRLRDRLPGGADLRDLDQVVHQRQAREAGLVGGQRDVRAARPRGRRPRGSARPGAPRRGRRGARGRAPARPPRPVPPRCPPPRRPGPSPRPRAPPAPAGSRGPAAVSTRAGTGRSRSALRRRHTSAGVSNATTTADSPCRRARSSHPVRRTSSRPSVSTTVVSPRRTRPATIRSRSANASADASRSCRPLPTTPRRSSEETTSALR